MIKKYTIIKYLALIIFISFYGFSIKAQHFNDSTTNILKSWKLPDLFEVEHYTIDDSTLENFQIYKPYEKEYITTSQLGNIGAAYISNHFFSRPDDFITNFNFNKGYADYIYSPSNLTFYNTRKPYTTLFYAGSSKIQDEQSLDFTHSQNINPNFNVTLNYNMISSKGQYLNQANKLSTISLTSNYIKKRITIHSAFNYNKFKLENNGGLIDTGKIDINSLSAYLTNANTTINNTDFLVSTKYSFGKFEKIRLKDTSINVVMPMVSLNYALHLSRKYRVYKDVESFEKGYYQNFYYGKDITYDSIALYNLANVFRFSSETNFEKKYKFAFNATFSNSFIHYYNFNDYITLNNENNFIENKVSGEITSLMLKRSKIKLFGTYYITGYRANDIRTGIEYKKNFGKKYNRKSLIMKVKYTSQKPNYFVQTFYSNHFRWENDFENMSSLDGSLIFNYPKLQFNLIANYANIQNYIYFGAIAAPLQYDKQLHIYSVQASKKIKLGKLHFFNKVVWQKSSNDAIVNLPEIIIFNSTFIELNYKHNLKLFIGIDINYTTEYNAISYNPAVGQFYFENADLTGKYPFGSVFVNAKIKKNVFIFAKLEHANSGAFLEKYTPVNNYLINMRMFILGVKWNFNN